MRHAQEGLVYVHYVPMMYWTVQRDWRVAAGEDAVYEVSGSEGVPVKRPQQKGRSSDSSHQPG